MSSRDAGEVLIAGMMKVSIARNLFKQVDVDKVSRGRFFTRKESWLTKPIREFIMSRLAFASNVLDPFAGEGDLLNVCSREFSVEVDGMDISNQGWRYNDSLICIPKSPSSIVVTNPPYLALYSAKRKGVFLELEKYFANTSHDDLYKIALDRCIESADFVVAIVPETFLNSSYPKKFLERVVVLEDSPFDDTDFPVCIACFDQRNPLGNQAVIYKGEHAVITIHELDSHRPRHRGRRAIRFNDPNGVLAFRAVDSTDPKVRAGFVAAESFRYGRENIKHSSRSMTYINIEGISNQEVEVLAERATEELERVRNLTSDLLFSPFKGNNKDGKRRRRVDYAIARAILNKVLKEEGLAQPLTNRLFPDA